MKNGSSKLFSLLLMFTFMLSLSACGGGGSSGSGNDPTTQMGGSIQGVTLALTGSVSTFAGTPPNKDGIGTEAKFNVTSDVTSDGTNLYVADAYNYSIRQVVIATGEVTTLAGSGIAGSADGTGTGASFYIPSGITTDGINLYVADTYNHTIRQIVIATGVVTTLAGTAGTAGSTDATGAAASFNMPYGIATDGINLYVADRNNHSIRQVVIATGVVTTLAGTGSAGSVDGNGTAASFRMPHDIAIDGTNLYVADTWNNTIRKIVISSGAVTTLAGTAGTSGLTDATGTAALFYEPQGIVSDGTNLYVAERCNHTIRQVVIATGAVTTLAGTGSVGAADGIGVAASFNAPRGMIIDGSNLYVADTYNHAIRQVVIATGEVTTLVGSGRNNGSIDGTGTNAAFDSPKGVTTDGTNLYVADTNNFTIRQIVIASGEVTTLAGSGIAGSTDGVGTAASFFRPIDITTDGTNLYVSDYNTIRQVVIASGEVTTLAGIPGDGGVFTSLQGITTDGTNLYVTDWNMIRQVEIASGTVTTFAGSTTAGATDGTGTAASFNSPQGITTDGVNLYVADGSNLAIRQIVIATGEVTTLAGRPGNLGSTDGIGTDASFAFPRAITSDGTNLYVADEWNQSIRQIAIASAEVTTLLGGRLIVYGITSDGTDLYVAETNKHLISRIR